MARYYSPGVNQLRIPEQGEYLMVGHDVLLVTSVMYDGHGGVQITIEAPPMDDPNMIRCRVCGSHRFQCPIPNANCCRGCSHEPVIGEIVDERVWPTS